MTFLRRLATDILHFMLPPRCIVCGNRLTNGESHLCINCLGSLPRTNFHLSDQNAMEQMFWGRINIVRATALFYYQGEETHTVLHNLKYYDNPDVGRHLGMVMAEEALDSGFFQDIDAIVPVPLHNRKERKRGYNQCLYIAEGLSEVTGIKVLHKEMVRLVNTKTQTRLSKDERWENVQDIFAPSRRCKVLPTCQHVLIIDDVVTTGSTLISLAKAIESVNHGIRFSVLSLAFASEFRYTQETNPALSSQHSDE
ncbi:MAG: ComF family protein [Bacteroidaceae bacterium]|nr:ComF family protein [Bacteroidaceae bacterium]